MGGQMLCKYPKQWGACGQCLPCRLNMRRIWTSRIMLEQNLHSDSSFLTLTYEDGHVPKTKDGLFNLNPVHLRNFWKKLRERFPYGSIRYYAVGEYGHEGDRGWNPHYHAALFGLQCKGKIQRPETGLRCYCANCETIRSAWNLGNITVDELNDTTASYIAGYVVKKLVFKDDLRLEGRHPEFQRQSQGIASGAVPDLVDALRSDFGHLAFQHGDIPVSLNRGGKSVVLGRYMRGKIREGLKMEKINPETGEVTYGTPYETLKWLHLEKDAEMLSLYSDLSNGKITFDDYYSQVKNYAEQRHATDQQKVRNLETRHEIGKSRSKGKIL